MIRLLYVAGIHHFDPLCRGRLLNWLKSLNKSHEHSPIFVAVEWDKDLFGKVVPQRPLLYRLAKKEWPQSSSFFLTILSEAMAFEGDTHIEVFPTVPILWLDSGRNVTLEIIEDYAKDRLNVYKSFLPFGVAKLDDKALLIMSKEAWNRSNKPTQGNSRDTKFAKSIYEHNDQLRNCWAIAIVGTNHASSVQDYMVSILIGQGIKCDMTILKPN